MAVVAIALIIVGLFVMAYGSLPIFVQAFRTSLAWGLGSLFLPGGAGVRDEELGAGAQVVLHRPVRLGDPAGRCGDPLVARLTDHPWGGESATRRPLR